MGFGNRGSRTENRGFTLLELMVTVGIVAVLTGLATLTASRYHRFARKVECQASIVHFVRAQELYYLDNQRYWQEGGDPWWIKTIGWTAANRPDQPEEYRFPELGVEFRPDRHRGYRIRVYNIQSFDLYWQRLYIRLKTTENFDEQPPTEDDYYYDKENRQTTESWGSEWGFNTDGRWDVENRFWFDIHGCPKFSNCLR